MSEVAAVWYQYFKGDADVLTIEKVIEEATKKDVAAYLSMESA